jgi:hypothetical protein
MCGHVSWCGDGRICGHVVGADVGESVGMSAGAGMKVVVRVGDAVGVLVGICVTARGFPGGACICKSTTPNSGLSGMVSG